MAFPIYRGLVLTILLGCGPLAWAEPPETFPSPAFHIGDSWVFDNVLETGRDGYGERHIDISIERLGSNTMTIGIKPDGATIPPEDHIVGTDWSHRELIDGKEMVTVRPFTFPMHVGQSWTIDYIDPARRGNQLSVHIHRTYSVTGWEDVTIPAGRFHALKIEADGVDQATIDVPNQVVGGVSASTLGATSVAHAQRGGTTVVSRVRHSELFYVPTVKNYVKSVEEQFNSDNIRISRQTSSLMSFTPAP